MDFSSRSNSSRIKYGAPKTYNRGAGDLSKFGRFESRQKLGAPITVRAPSSKAPPFGKLLQKIDSDCDGASIQQSAVISNTRLLGSYNWAGSSDYSIIFPGLPPAWKPLTQATQLSEDAGVYYRDSNACRYPEAPMEPAVRAILQSHPIATFDTQAYDLFACNKTLGNLLKTLTSEKKEFRFLMKAVGNTVFFEHRENSAFEKILGFDGGLPHGYGHSFPEHTTKWSKDVRDSTSHQRMISYEFAGLDLIVRYEGDGYFHDKFENRNVSSAESAALAEMECKILESTDFYSLEKDPSIVVSGGGRFIPQSTVFEIKTRSAFKQPEAQSTIEEHLPRLWLTGIPYFILAYHQKGKFSPVDISITDVKERVATWERKEQGLLRKFAFLIQRLIKIARDSHGTVSEVCYHGTGQIEIREPGGQVGPVVPEKLSQIWANLVESSSEGPDDHSSEDYHLQEPDYESLGQAAYSDDEW